MLFKNGVYKWECPKSGKEYDFDHLKPIQLSYELSMKAGQESISLPCKVFFTEHCITKLRESHHSNEDVVYTDHRRNKPPEDRVFCEKRWEFSKNIPQLIRSLMDKQCLQGSKQEMVIKHEATSNTNPNEGWYVFLKLRYLKKNNQLRIDVVSAHKRTNKPTNIRGHGKSRFKVLLRKFLEGKV